MIYRTAPFSVTLKAPTPGFKVTPFFDAEYLRNGMRYRHFQWNTNKDLHTPYNDTKRRAVSLRQLSFLSKKSPPGSAAKMGLGFAGFGRGVGGGLTLISSRTESLEVSSLELVSECMRI